MWSMADHREVTRFTLYREVSHRGRILRAEPTHHHKGRKRCADLQECVAGLTSAEFAAVPDHRWSRAFGLGEFGHLQGVGVTFVGQRPLRIDPGVERLCVMNEIQLHVSPAARPGPCE